MIVVLATDLPSGIRKPWTLDFRTIPEHAGLIGDGPNLRLALTDCVWIVPGTLDFDA